MEHPIQGTFPVLAIRNSVLFPGLALPLRVGRAKSVAAVERAHARGGWILAVAQSIEGAKEATPDELYRVGTLCKIERLRGNASDGYQILARGVARFRVLSLGETGDGGTAWLEAEAEALKDVIDTDEGTARALAQSLKSVAAEILKLLPAETGQLTDLIDGIEDPIYLTHLCAGNLEISLAQRQELLETVSLKARVLRLLELMQAQKDSLQIRSEIRDKLSHKMGKMQRDALLREQMKTIRDELGEGDDDKAADDYRARIDAAGMPEAARKAALEELRRLEAAGNSSPEAHVIRTYLDLMVSLPWSKSAASAGRAESLDLAAARSSLDRDHYGLDKIKKRIVQHLTVMKAKKGARGSILLFVGPPGVGKTSLGESIARVMGRKFARGSLGGVRDDAEIRGHRKTYVGAMPGRIIQGIKRAGENNPVFMLDEIDKLGRGFQGDPAAALLEVLDPEQNGAFLDHYLDVPFDLSKVFFIATANSLDGIPGPLLDRMEVIELSGYTSSEKFRIARDHLVPRQLEEFGLAPGKLEITDEALTRVISHYTREAGVRSLKREIATLARASVERVLDAETKGQLPVRVDVADLEELLGPERFLHEVVDRITPAGVVTGLAWTPHGGEILFVEASLMPGTGKLILTGQLGDVMKESAQIALSLARSRLSWLTPGLEHDKRDLHIHVPAGAIPKDGPSAGVTMLTTIASLLSGRKVSPRLAMTGEITLRGAVTPVGGIKEKLIAAQRAGIERVILPKRNQRDLAEVPEEVRSNLRIDFAETAADVLRAALGLDVSPELLLEAPPVPSKHPPAVA